jgi:DNA-binding PadR family transcriptional regulator
MVTLGLVIEMPDHTVKDVGVQLCRRFTKSNFSRSTADNAIVRLLKHGWIECIHEAPGRGRASSRHVATPLGERVFHDWMYDLPGRDGWGQDPVLREAMFGRLQLCKEEDIPRLLVIAKQEVAVSEDLYNVASKRLREQEDSSKLLKQVRPERKKRPTERVRDILMVVEPLHWLQRGNFYELIADELETIIADMQPELSEA